MVTSALIISTYNSPDALNLCLQSVNKQIIKPNEIIIADDGSEESTCFLVERFKQQTCISVKYVWQEDKGFRLSKIRNEAIKQSNSEYLIFIDGDVILHPLFVHDHLSFSREERFLTGSRVLLSQKDSDLMLKAGEFYLVPSIIRAKNRINGLSFKNLANLLSGYDSRIFNVRGCNMSFWKKDLIEVDGFDEQFEGWGREDSDVVQRLLNLGIKRYKLKFAGIQYHIFHTEQDREFLARNEQLVRETQSGKRIKARKGLRDIKP